MTSTYNTNIILDGLTFHVDAANSKSYRSGSTTWYDLGPNSINLTSYGTVNYTTLGGAACLGFNGSMYWYSSTADAQKTDYRYGSTIEMWLYNQTKGTRRTVFEKAGNAHASYEQEIAMTWETGDNISCYRAYNSYDYGGSPTLSVNAWNHVILVLFPHLSPGQWYLNGVAGGSYTQRAIQLPAQANGIYIGTGYAGTVDNGGVAIVRTYSRMFDAADAQQNFNAQRNRFGV